MPTNSLRRASIRWRPLLFLAGAGAAVGATAAAHGAARGGPTSTATASQEARRALSANFAKTPLQFEVNRGQVSSEVDFISRGPGYTLYLGPDRSAMTMLRSPSAAELKTGKRRSAGVGMILQGANRKARGEALGLRANKSNYFLGTDAKKWQRDVANYSRVKYQGVYPGVDVVYYGTQRQLEYDFVVKPGANPDDIRFLVAGCDRPRLEKSGDLIMPFGQEGEVRQQRPVAYQVIDGKKQPVAAQYLLNGRQVRFALGKYDHSRELVIDPVLTYSTYVGGTLDDYGMDVAVDASGNAYITGYTGSFPKDVDTRPGGTVNRDAMGATTPAPQPSVAAQTGFPVVGGVPAPGGTDRDTLSINFDLDQLSVGTTRATVSMTYYDTFVAKMNPSGTALVYSTYIGAIGDDYGTSIAVDGAGAAYITGLTKSTSWPLVKPIQATSSGSGDAYALKLNPAGNAIVFSTYLGGSGNDQGRSISVDSLNNCVIAGITTSTNFPVVNAFQPALGGGRDYFVLSINSQGTALTFSTYFGGLGNEGGLPFSHSAATAAAIIGNPRGRATNLSGFPPPPAATAFGSDFGVDVTTDTRGYVYVAGTTAITASGNITGTTGAFQSTPQSAVGGTDAFVAKLTSTGQRVLAEGCYTTFLGGGSDDGARGIAVDVDGAAYVTGYTTDASFPVTAPNVPVGTAGRRQTTFGGGSRDAYVLKLNPNGTGRDWATFVGGSGDDAGFSIAVNAQKRVYVLGITDSTDLGVVNQLQSSLFQLQDAMILKLDQNGDTYEYLTYFGSNGEDWGQGIAVDPSGIAYVAGIARGTSFMNGDNLPTTLGAFQPNSSAVNDQNYLTGSAKADVFLARIANPPLAPTNLTVKAVTTSTVSLDWNDNSDNETNFIVERKTGPTGVFAQIASLPANTVSFTDTGLTSGLEYTYRVYALNAEGGSGYSNAVTVTTLPTPPTAPSGLTVVTAGKNQLRLNWTDNSNNETGFRIERRQIFPNPSIYTEIFVALPNATSYTDNNDGNGLPSNVTYEYRVRATNGGGESNYTNTAQQTTLPDKPSLKPTLALSSPATSRESVITLTITYPAGMVTPTQAEARVDGFQVFRSTDGVQFDLLRVVPRPAGPATTFPFTEVITDSALLLDTRYYYKVAAYNFDGVGPQSDPASQRTATEKPTNLTAAASVVTPGVVSVALTWKDNALTETGYQIERTETGGATVTLPIQPAVASTGGTGTFTDSTVLPDKEYSYRVRTINGSGAADNSNESDWSNTATIKTAPSVPTALSVFGTNSSTVTASFTDNGSQEAGFRLYRSTGGGPFTQVASTGTPSAGTGLTATLADTTVAANTTYTYYVVAYNAGGESPASTQDTVSTVARPTGLVATAVSQSSIALSWTDNATTETAYRVLQSLDGVTFTTVVDPVPGLATTGAATGASSVTITGLSVNTRYYFQVQAYNPKANSTVSATADTVTLPPAPTGVSARATATDTVQITFQDATDAENGFKVYRDGVEVPSARVNTGTAGSGNTIVATDSTASGDQTYIYTVTTVNTSGGESAQSAPSNAVKTMLAPTGTTLTAAINSLTVQWTDNSAQEEGYSVEVALAGSGTWTAASTGAVMGTGSTGSYVIMGLQPNTKYDVRVRATNTTGGGSFSSYSSTATKTTLAPAATEVAARALDSTTVQVTFTDPTASETGFALYRSDNGGAFAKVGQTAGVAGLGTTITMSDTVVAENDYVYLVRTLNLDGAEGPDSATAAVSSIAAPTATVATPTSQTTIDVTFTDNSTREGLYELEMSPNGSSGWAVVGQTIGAVSGTGSSTTLSVSGLTANTTYFFRLRGRNGNNYSSYSNVVNTTTLKNVPTAPSNLTATALSQTSVRLTWTDNADNEDGFHIERSKNNFGSIDATLTVSTPAGGTGSTVTYVDTTATDDTTYQYRVKAFNNGGDSPASNTATVKTPAYPPTAPTNLSTVLVSKNQIDLTWTDKANNEQGFIIVRSTDGVNFTELTRVGASAGVDGTVSYQDKNLLADRNYTYKVRSYNDGGSSASDAGPSSKFTPPAAPSNLVFTSVTNNTIRIFWVDNSTTAQSFIVERSTAGGPFVQVGSVNVPNTTFADTGLSGETAYAYRVKATNGAVDGLGNAIDSDYAGPISAVTLPDPPAAPTIAAAVATSQTQATITWIDNSLNEDGFNIYRSRDTAIRQYQLVSVKNGRTAGTGEVLTFTDSNLTPNTGYVYVVRAFNAGGESQNSNEGIVTTPPVVPTSPSNLIVSALTDVSVNLQWTDNSTNESSFLLERSLDGISWTPVGGSIGPSAGSGSPVTASDGGLTANTSYRYRVSAINSGGASGYSNIRTVRTLPSAPSNLSAVANGDGSVTLTWTANSGSDGFRVFRRASGGAFTEVKTVGGGVTSTNDVPPTAGVLYTYQVVAYNVSGNSAASNTADATAPFVLLTVKINDADGTLKANKKSTGTVTLNGPAPAGGVRVAVSANLNAVKVPATVTIPQGATTANFNIKVGAVSRRRELTISASYNGVTRTATAIVKP